jgi:hypothetical protein
MCVAIRRRNHVNCHSDRALQIATGKSCEHTTSATGPSGRLGASSASDTKRPFRDKTGAGEIEISDIFLGRLPCRNFRATICASFIHASARESNVSIDAFESRRTSGFASLVSQYVNVRKS